VRRGRDKLDGQIEYSLILDHCCFADLLQSRRRNSLCIRKRASET
jgi:hypothetical protein